MRHHAMTVPALAAWLAIGAFAQIDSSDPWRQLMRKGTGLDTGGYYAAAVVAFEGAVRLAEQSRDRRLPLALNALANVQEELGNFQEAEHLYRRALSLASREGKMNAAYAVTLGNFGSHYYEVGQPAKAESMLRESLAIYSAFDPPDEMQIALSRNALANVIVAGGHYREAEELVEASLAVFRKDPERRGAQLAIGLNNLGVVRRYQSRDQEATELFEQSVQITGTELGKDHPTLLRALNNLATMYSRIGRYEEAETTFQRDLEIARKRLGSTHPIYARILLNYATHLRQTGQKSVAKTVRAEANALLRDSARTNGSGLTIDVSSFRH